MAVYYFASSVQIPLCELRVFVKRYYYIIGDLSLKDGLYLNLTLYFFAGFFLPKLTVSL